MLNAAWLNLMLCKAGKNRLALTLVSKRWRHYYKNMGILEPPDSVKGMTVLNREAFNKCVPIPKIRILETQANNVIPLIRTLLLKMEQLKNVKVVKSENDKMCREILLHPTPVKSWESLPTHMLRQYEVKPSDFSVEDLVLTYNNWRADEIFRKVLPYPENTVSSFSRIGHIVHVNLKDVLIPYKTLIGEVLLDKIPGCRTVVNKVTVIDNTYRNFQMELLAGEPDYKVETRENKIFYEFDFSKVYWNPRLNTEHLRVTQRLREKDVLYDIFAGVGPFSVPAAMKKCCVYANDLNPESYFWLKHNLKKNKCSQHAKLFNKDGREFIREVIKPDLIYRWRNLERRLNYYIHITMNLPAMAVEFLDAFRGLLEAQRNLINFDSPHINYPTVHCYYFAKGTCNIQNKELCLQTVEKSLGIKLYKSLLGISFVRNVGLRKDMYRISFKLNKRILTTQKAPDGIIEIDEEMEALEKLEKEEEANANANADANQNENAAQNHNEDPPIENMENEEPPRNEENSNGSNKAVESPAPPNKDKENENQKKEDEASIPCQKRYVPLDEKNLEDEASSPKLAKTNN